MNALSKKKAPQKSSASKTTHTPAKASLKQPKPSGKKSGEKKTGSELQSSKSPKGKPSSPPDPVQTASVQKAETSSTPRRSKMSKTTHLTAEAAAKLRSWVHIDARGKVLGRLAVKIATLVSGKDKPEYSPHLDLGNYVVVTHAKDLVLTGAKWKNRRVYSHSGYMGHLKSQSAIEFHQKHPEDLLKMAVKNMLPKTKLGKLMLKKLKVYAGPEHDHQAQQPKTLEITL
jgi:large subunit ribosomal protein L13